MTALISTIVAFFVAGLAVLGLVPHQAMQLTPQPDQEVGQSQNVATDVSEVPPTSNLLTMSATSGTAPLSVAFTIADQQDWPCSGMSSASFYHLYYGDGSDDVVKVCGAPGTASHTYTTAGTFTAQLMSMCEKGGGPNCERQVASQTIIVEKSEGSAVSVSGMQKYTDPDFGFSFWYPSKWNVSTLNVTPDSLYLNDANGKTIFIISRFSGSTIDIGPGRYDDQQFYFNSSMHTWMTQHMTDADNDVGDKPILADVSVNTMGGLHIFSYAASDTRIVPLSATYFVDVINGPYNSNFAANYLVKTIIATDPSVATPVSAAEQTRVIQAEKDAYTGQ